MKFIFITIVTFIVCLQQAKARYQVIRLGGYLWVSLDGKPYVRLARDGQDLFLSQEADENQSSLDLDPNDSLAMADESESIDASKKEASNWYEKLKGSQMKRNPMWNYIPRKKSYIRLSKKPNHLYIPRMNSYQKRLNYVRLAKKNDNPNRK